MNQTGQFSVEPKTTNHLKSLSISQRNEVEDISENYQANQNKGSSLEIEAEEPEPARVDAESSDADAYSNDFIKDASSSRGEKYGHVDEKIDAMRLNSFPIFKK